MLARRTLAKALALPVSVLASHAAGAAVPTAMVLGYRPNRPPPFATLGEIRAYMDRDVRRQDSAGPASATTASPVLVMPAMLRNDTQTLNLRADLTQHGYRSFGWDLGTDFGPTRRLMAGAEARLVALSDAHGPIQLVGVSMGGLFCRWLAASHPDRVSHVVTVCSPFRAPLDSCVVSLRPFLGIWSAPGLGDLANELARPVQVPQTRIYSPNDGIVAWESCIDPSRPEDCFSIKGHHVTAANDPDVLAILVRRLALH